MVIKLRPAVVAAAVASTLHNESSMKMFQTIDLDNVFGGAAVTPDNFMPRAYALQALNSKNDASPTPALKQQIHSEFCGNLYPYAKSGAPINSMIGGIARSKMIEAGATVCK